MSTPEIAPHLSIYRFPWKAMLSSNTNHRHIIVSACVFSELKSPQQKDASRNPNENGESSRNTEPHLLLMQRSLSDSYGGYWEGPGGTYEKEDGDIFETLVREVYEESGLHVSRVIEFAGTEHWDVGSASNEISDADSKALPEKAIKYSFLVDVEEAKVDGWETRIKLAANEHEQYMWATEEDVKDVHLRGKDRFKFGGDEGPMFLTAFEQYRLHKHFN